MLADLDLLLTVVYCMADDFLPERPGNARRTSTTRRSWRCAWRRR